MDDDDLPPSAAKNPPKPKDLSPLSVAELEVYIDRLKAEIARVEDAIRTKRGQRTGAEAFFRK
jgi:uncharacterized small protein (DUF1192 family)